MEQKAWTLLQLSRAMQEDLQLCHTDLERSICRAIATKEIREFATEIRMQRALTPGETAVLESL